MDETGATQPTGGMLAVFEPAVGARRARRYLWLCRLPDQRRVRLAAGQGHRAFRRRGAGATSCRRRSRALREFRIDGVATNIAFLAGDPRRIPISPPTASRPASSIAISPSWSTRPRMARRSAAATKRIARHGAGRAARRAIGPAGSVPVAAPLQGTIVTIDVTEGDLVRPGQQIAVIESMKMEHLVIAPHGGSVTKLAAGDGTTLMQGEPIMFLEPLERRRADRRRGSRCRSRPYPP